MPSLRCCKVMSSTPVPFTARTPTLCGSTTVPSASPARCNSGRSAWIGSTGAATHPASVALSGDFELDRERLEALVGELRQKLPYLPEDPYLLYATDVHNSEAQGANQLPAAEDAVAALMAAGEGRDLVGIYAAGGVYAGFANGFGQRNWFANYSFNADWSFYHEKDKAVKNRLRRFGLGDGRI